MLLLMPLAPVKADEGMWLLPLLEKMNSGKMTELGFEITPQQIYDINNSSLKDAIVIFGGGCTGEIVSDQGLLFTNHHCGFGTIQSLSSGLSVRFLESFTDVTADVNKALAKAKTPEDKEKAMTKLENKLAKKAGCDGKFVVGGINSFYGGNTYYFIVYKVFRDVRFGPVTPETSPSSVCTQTRTTIPPSTPRTTCPIPRNSI